MKDGRRKSPRGFRDRQPEIRTSNPASSRETTHGKKKDSERKTLGRTQREESGGSRGTLEFKPKDGGLHMSVWKAKGRKHREQEKNSALSGKGRKGEKEATRLKRRKREGRIKKEKRRKNDDANMKLAQKMPSKTEEQPEARGKGSIGEGEPVEASELMTVQNSFLPDGRPEWCRTDKVAGVRGSQEGKIEMERRRKKLQPNHCRVQGNKRRKSRRGHKTV